MKIFVCILIFFIFNVTANCKNPQNKSFGAISNLKKNTSKEKKTVNSNFIIKKGDKVTIISQRPGISIQAQAVAYENGNVGDFISFQVLEISKKNIKAKILNKGVAIV